MEFVVFGRDVIDNPSVGTESGAGNEGDGIARVTSGSQPFGDDQIIVFTAVNLTANGQINPNSAISDVTVFADRAAFEAGTPLFNYSPQNPGQTANVQSDLSGLGDGYVRFNANVLRPDDGGPTFNQLFVAPGTDLGPRLANGETVFLDRNQDFDFNGDGDFDDPIEDGDTLFFVGDYTTPVVCVARGTRIRTPQGERLIETLKPGDRVITYDRGVQVLRWIGHRKVPARGPNAPIQISQGCYGAEHDLFVSPNHRILRSGSDLEMYFDVSSALVAAKYLVDSKQVQRVAGKTIEYYHLLFDAHELIWANGVLCESLLPITHVESLSDRESWEETNALLGPLPQKAKSNLP